MTRFRRDASGVRLRPALIAIGLLAGIGQADEAPAAGDETSRSGRRAEPSPAKRKPNETLSSVINESTAGPAVDLLKQNTAFVLPGGDAWAVSPRR